MPDGKSETKKSVFKRSVSVSAVVDASPAKLWTLLTNAAGFPKWNSTVTSIEGCIAAGERLALRVPISPRVFKPKVTEFDAPRRMVWRDGAAPMFQGVRVFELAALDSNRTRFTMTETLSGAMLPLIGPSLPDFAPVFERYAADLKRAAEA